MHRYVNVSDTFSKRMYDDQTTVADWFAELSNVQQQVLWVYAEHMNHHDRVVLNRDQVWALYQKAGFQSTRQRVQETLYELRMKNIIRQAAIYYRIDENWLAQHPDFASWFSSVIWNFRVGSTKSFAEIFSRTPQHAD